MITIKKSSLELFLNLYYSNITWSKVLSIMFGLQKWSFLYLYDILSYTTYICVTYTWYKNVTLGTIHLPLNLSFLTITQMIWNLCLELKFFQTIIQRWRQQIIVLIILIIYIKMSPFSDDFVLSVLIVLIMMDLDYLYLNCLPFTSFIIFLYLNCLPFPPS